jgi:transposase
MGKSTKKVGVRYTPEFRRQMVELVRAGRKASELAREFGVTSWSIGRWVAQAERDAGRGDDGLTTAERQELARLRRENRQLKLEREILSIYIHWTPTNDRILGNELMVSNRGFGTAQTS